MTVQSIAIFDNQQSDVVPARFHADLLSEQFICAELTWGPAHAAALTRLLEAKTPANRLPRHAHWNWSRKASLLNLLAYRGFGIECEGEWQGLMLTLSVGHVTKLPPDEGKPLVYIDFLESAPWNVIPLTDKPRYKGIGARLVEAAIRQSIGDGFKGRIGLHVLRDAERFYENRGMTRAGPDPNYYDLVYFEFTSADAMKFITRGVS